MTSRVVTATCVLVLLVGRDSAAQGKGAHPPEVGQPVLLTALSNLPVREITVFKDGHAFLSHEGEIATDDKGHAHVDRLPTPVVGTFWAYSADPNVELKAVVASRRRVRIEETALSVQELLRANVGAQAFITESGKTYLATILDIPTRSSEELARTNPPGADQMLPQQGTVMLLETDMGVKVVPIDRIQDVTFKKPPKTSLEGEEFRNLLTLKLDWGNRPRTETARVGVTYLQKGVRWIPSYKVVLDGQGHAVVKLQATLLNELTDLEDVTTHLVIGVPTFKFKDTIDPIALQQTLAQLSPYFQAGAAQGFDNALMTQVAVPRQRPGQGEYPGAVDRPASPVDLGPELAGSEAAEDLYVFTVEHISLKKGQRMVLPIAECKLGYKDVFTLDLPSVPPAEIRQESSSQLQAEIALLLRSPKVVHKIRLVNEGPFPLTTAPALVIRNDRILAQSMMTYTAVGASGDLEITPALDIRVSKTDRETQRTPNAVTWNRTQYGRIDLAGTISLTSYRSEPVELEVARHIAGNVDSAEAGGQIEMVNALEYDQQTWHAGGSYAANWHRWPGWWLHFNGFGRVTWKVRLEPGKSVDLTYTWHYYSGL